MSYFLPTIILRHRKENVKKCSLKGLEGRKDLNFLEYPKDLEHLYVLDLAQYIVLDLESPVLTEKDQECGLLLIDGTWKYAQTMSRMLPQTLKKRSLPPYLQTAYPRKNTACIDPSRGLASVEALYASYTLLHRNPEGLLDHYYWKEAFLKKNLYL